LASARATSRAGSIDAARDSAHRRLRPALWFEGAVAAIACTWPTVECLPIGRSFAGRSQNLAGPADVNVARLVNGRRGQNLTHPPQPKLSRIQVEGSMAKNQNPVAIQNPLSMECARYTAFTWNSSRARLVTTAETWTSSRVEPISMNGGWEGCAPMNLTV
jgi:hypothetical protein